jgi:hypothetical protein
LILSFRSWEISIASGSARGLQRSSPARDKPPQIFGNASSDPEA